MVLTASSSTETGAEEEDYDNCPESGAHHVRRQHRSGLAGLSAGVTTQSSLRERGNGAVTMLVQWDPGYRMGVVEHHEYDEHLYILAGTFVDHNRACGPGTYILNRAGSEHQCSTPDGCTFLEVVPGRR